MTYQFTTLLARQSFMYALFTVRQHFTAAAARAAVAAVPVETPVMMNADLNDAKRKAWPNPGRGWRVSS